MTQENKMNEVLSENGMHMHESHPFMHPITRVHKVNVLTGIGSSNQNGVKSPVHRRT